MKFLLPFFFLLPFCLFADSMRVCPTCPVQTIRAAIGKAKENDTIWIEKGIYREKNILIEKKLSLIGLNFPVLDGENQYEILTVQADGVLIKGLEIRRSGKSSLHDLAGIKVNLAKNVQILNNRLYENYFAIYLLGTAECTVFGNQIKGNPTNEQNTGNAIHLWRSEKAHIEQNTTSGHRDGIYFEFVTDSKIIGNHSHHNIRYGLHFMFSHHNFYQKNTFEENGAGVAVMYSNHVQMQGNIFRKNWGSAAYGLLLKDISDSQIENNVFEQNTIGIYMEGSSRMKMQDNDFLANGWALRIQASCDDNTFIFNNFESNTFDVATNGTTVLNTFDQNYWDKYEGYDLKRDGTGDVPYHPVSMYAMVVEQMPFAAVLLRSLVVSLLDRAEKAIPSLTPENLLDNKPFMNRIRHD
jgi:nitrous oxidase accessory protein